MNKIYKYMRPFSWILKYFPGEILSFRFRRAYHRGLQKPPKSFYDKVFWMSIHSDTRLWSELADKYCVRKYVADRCGDEILTKLYGVYYSVNEIDFDKLPDTFVIKTNNGCTSNYFVKDKKQENLDKIRKFLDYYMKFPYGILTGQKHYSRIKPKIIAEEYLIDRTNPNSALHDYKFYCFNGKPTYCWVVSDRELNTHNYKCMMYDMEWNPMKDCFVNQSRLKETPRPGQLDKMIQVATILSNGLNFVRVDLYDVNDEVKFSELTFMPGTDEGFTEEFLSRMGDLITL